MAGVEWVSAGAAASAAVAGVGVALATYRLARSTNLLADLTARTLTTAERQVHEAIRARADERAPRVVVILAPTEWPPYSPPGTAGDEAQRMDDDREFVTPSHDDTLIMLRTYGLLCNEGASTATLTLNGRADFVDGVGPFRPPTPQLRDRSYSSSDYRVPTKLGGGRYALGPGEVALFRFEDWRSFSDWRHAWEARAEAPPESKLFLEIIVADQFDDGVVDNISVEVQSYPVEPTAHDLGRWRIRHVSAGNVPSAVGNVVYPTRRRYWASKRANDELAI